MAIEFFPGLSKNFSLLLGGDADDYDVTINVGKGSNAKEFRAHSNILKVRSPYLKNLLSKKGKEDLIINETEISPRVFEMIIGYIYTGLLDLDSQSDPDIFELILASHRLFLEELITYVPKYLVEKRYEWIEQNFEMVLHEAFRLKGCRKLQDYCLDYICEEPKPFFKSESQNLEKTVLLGLFKRDHLRVKEIDIWNYLIKWGIAHSSELKGKDMTNLNNWDKKDFIALKKTLNQFISNIRFFVISSADFDEKVQPFAEVLPKKLYQEILSYHKDNIQPSPDTFLPPRQGKVFVDSKIINRRHAAILANWIQRNDPYDRIPINVRYNLDLIYHGSRDGYDIDTVRTKCHTQGSCILVMKIEGNDAIIGGYNPIGWNHINTNYSSEHTFSWIDTNESFIFSLDGKDLNNIKISRVVDSTKALYESNFYNYKLNFGNSDLIINVSDNFGTCNQRNYESSILVPNIFFIKEIEIFKIVKREILQDDL